MHQLENALADLPQLSEDEQAELNALARLSDEALWTIARERMHPDRQARLMVLMDKSDRGTLEEEEPQELPSPGNRIAGLHITVHFVDEVPYRP